MKLAAPTAEGAEVARGLRDSLNFAREPLAGLTHEERLALRDLLRRMLGESGSQGESEGVGEGA